MRKTFLIVAIFILTSITLGTPQYVEKISSFQSIGDYPTPPKTDKMLFYVQRSHNKNTIVYDLNFKLDKKLNNEEPIHPYWIRYEEGGVKKELSYIQKKYAYGLEFNIQDSYNSKYKVYFVCYSKKYFELMKSPKDNKMRAYITVNNKFLELEKIFIKTDGGTFWFPTVKYIDITGKDATGKTITERMIP